MALFLVAILRLLIVAVAEIKQSTAKAAPVSLELRQASIKFSVTPASHGGKSIFRINADRLSKLRALSLYYINHQMIDIWNMLFF